MSQDTPNSDDDEVECSNDKCPQNDGGVCFESREDCKRRVLEEYGIRLSQGS
jgi:hypothetical protein